MKTNLTLLVGMLVATAASNAFACGGNGTYSPTSHYTASCQSNRHLVTNGGFTVSPSPARVAPKTAAVPQPVIETPPPAPLADASLNDNRQSTTTEPSTTKNALETFFSELSTQDLLKFAGLPELR